MVKLGERKTAIASHKYTSKYGHVSVMTKVEYIKYSIHLELPLGQVKKVFSLNLSLHLNRIPYFQDNVSFLE